MMYKHNYQHQYSLAATGIRFRDRIFGTRAEANQEMYRFCKKHNISILEIYNDNHYKTYICTNGIRFYIQRGL